MKKCNPKMNNLNSKNKHKMMKNLMKFLMMLKNLKTRIQLKKTINNKAKICLTHRMKSYRDRKSLKPIKMLQQTKTNKVELLRIKMQKKKKMKGNNR